MDQQFTIRDFIDNRWADAKHELSRLDSVFVRTVESIDNSQKLGLVIPGVDSLTVPTTRLPSNWHELLALTMECVTELDRLHMTVSLMDPVSSPGIDRRLCVYYFDVWVQRVFNLCEKVERLVVKSCRLLLRGNSSTEWKERETHYRSLIKSQVQNEIEELRSPSVHGAGGKGLLSARVMSEEHQRWEIIVVGGPHMIDDILKQSYGHVGLLPPPAFFKVVEGKTDYVIQTLGGILLELDRELTRANVS